MITYSGIVAGKYKKRKKLDFDNPNSEFKTQFKLQFLKRKEYQDKEGKQNTILEIDDISVHEDTFILAEVGKEITINAELWQTNGASGLFDTKLLSN
ncbi:MAG: hypothetical protein M0R46_10035 [Candidatus Muirbacterium halophilum]|nr:hypothetical protein [Candidatus Muirbacterium halophilum]